MLATVLCPTISWAFPEVFINEFHYDNSGLDVNEGVEIAGQSGVNLAGWNLALYNGFNGQVYSTISLSGIISNQNNNFGALFFGGFVLQNGSPDAIALVNPSASVMQFISYEGTLTALNGPANGLDSIDIGISEISAPLGYSLQLIGSGNSYADFTWHEAMPSTYDAINTNQFFSGEDVVPEPTTFLLFGVGLLPLLRRKKLT